MNFGLSLTTKAVVMMTVMYIISAVATESVENNELKLAEYCNPAKCKLPNCRCSGLSLPAPEFLGKEDQITQFITVTFDDAVNTINYVKYKELFDDLVNSDNCPARGTFFVSHEYTDYSKVNALYNEGHEIALHSVTHGSGTNYWRNASVELIMSEFGDQIKILEAFAKVDPKHIRGMRLPFLQMSGNNTFQAAKRLGLLYDSSLPTQDYSDPAMWPYTLDYKSIQDCQIGPCPDASIPGFWINPMVSWEDTEGYFCPMIDACVYPPKDDVDELLEWMGSNFNRHYEGNRAPFGMYIHSAWFSRFEHGFLAFKEFLHHVITLPNVYITTTSRVIEYMQKPVLGKPFNSCVTPPRTTCKPKVCGLKKISSNGEQRYMTVCNRCPVVYPWLDNPLGYY